MKKSLSALFVIVVLLALVCLLTPLGRECAALLQLSSASEEEDAFRFPAAYNKGEEALKKGRLEEARRLIDEGKAQSKDSNEYYRFEVLDTKYYFYTMQADSFLSSHRRLRHYLDRHKGENSARLRLLRVESELQQGVFEAKMVGRMDSAQQHYMKALKMSEQMCCSADYRLLILTNIADAYKQTGRYDQCVTYYREAIELGDSVGMSDATRITLDIGIASAFTSMHSFDQSAEWWETTHKMKPHMERTELFHYLNNRGNDYYLQGRYQESLDCFLELDSILSGDPNLHWECMFGRCNLSDVYLKLGNIERAKSLLDETELFFTQQNQPLPLFYLTTQRIDLAIEEGRLQEAERLVAANPIPDWMIPDQKLLRQQVLMRLYQQQGRWQQYSQQVLAYTQLRDSIASDNKKMRFSEALLHYQHEKEMYKKQLQLEEKEFSYRWSLHLLGAAILVIVLLIIIFVQKQRERKLRESEMRNSIAGLRMETVRNRITPHFISNALTAEIVAQMDGKEANLESLVQLLHRGIELTDVEQSTLNEELEFIRFYCNVESRSVGDDFCLKIELDQAIDADRVMLPSMCVQILVENAIKHGLKRKKPVEGRQRTVVVRATKKENATLVEVIDNGTGLPEDRKNKERTGLRVMRQTIHLLNEQQLYSPTYHSHDVLMDYGLDNYRHPDGDTGCRAWLLLPDKFDYTLKRRSLTNS